MTGQQNSTDRRGEHAQEMAAALARNDALVHWTVQRQWLGSLGYQLEGLGLLRLPCHGLRRARTHVPAADFLINLRNLGRLLREASLLAS